MKKITIILLLALISAGAGAQAPFVQWQRSLGGSAVEAAYTIQHTSDSGYITACTSSSVNGDVTGNHGFLDSWLVKLSPWGSIVWQKSLGGTSDEQAYDVRPTADGGYIVANISSSNDGDVSGNHGGKDFWIVKLDDTGKIQWQRSFGGSGSDVPMAARQTSDNGYIVAGWTTSNDGDVTGNHGSRDYWVLKLNPSGGIIWEKTYGGTDDDIATSIQQTADGGYIVAGNSASTDGDVTGNHGGDDYWIVKLSSAGIIEWQKSLGGSGDEDDGDEAYPGTIQQTIDGGYVVAGTSNSNDGDVSGNHGGFFDYWVVKLSSTGGLVWQKCLGGSGDDDAYTVHQTADAGYIVSGTSNSTDGDVTGNYGTYDYWIVKLSSSGGLVWEKNYGGSHDEYAYYIHATSDSEFIACGYSKSNDTDVTGNHGDYDGWVVKLAYCSLPAAGTISGPSLVCAGSGIQLSDNVTGGAWSASNGNASVSISGLVTGLYAGAVAVFYTKTNTCGTGGASYMVSVSHPGPVITAAGAVLNTTLAYNKYQWIKNGTPVTGATKATYTATANGVYSVTVTDANGCTGTSAADTVSGLDISTINNSLNCTVTPNPTTGAVYIMGARNVNIKIYSIIGQLIKEANNTDRISISELPAAMYLIRLSDEQGRFIRQEKILKE